MREIHPMCKEHPKLAKLILAVFFVISPLIILVAMLFEILKEFPGAAVSCWASLRTDWKNIDKYQESKKKIKHQDSTTRQVVI